LCATSFSVSLKSEQRARNGEQQHRIGARRGPEPGAASCDWFRGKRGGDV
jgi:hypothetical protein